MIYVVMAFDFIQCQDILFVQVESLIPQNLLHQILINSFIVKLRLDDLELMIRSTPPLEFQQVLIPFMFHQKNWIEIKMVNLVYLNIRLLQTLIFVNQSKYFLVYDMKFMALQILLASILYS